MKPEEFNKIVDRAISPTKDPNEARSRHQDTVNNALLGRIAQLEADVGYLRGGTAWNEVAQKMLTFERSLSELKSIVSPIEGCLKVSSIEVWNPQVGDQVWFIDGTYGDVAICKGRIDRIDRETAPIFSVLNKDHDCEWKYSVYLTREDAIKALRLMVDKVFE
mgnify:CR=1 FL=1